MRFLIILGAFFAIFSTISFAQTNSSFDEEEVVVHTGYNDIKLAGTLTKPGNDGRFPCAILIWGNGPHTRDQVISGTPMFKQIAEYLAGIGYATLRVDKRGFGDSDGEKAPSETITTTLDLVHDIKACYEYLEERNDIDKNNIGLIGHSEGALIATVLASVEGIGVDWLILLSAPGAPAKDIFLKQRYNNAVQLGIDPEIISKVQKVWKNFIDFSINDLKNDSLYYSIGHEFLRVQGVEEKDNTNDFVDMVIDGFRTEWYRTFFQLDPADYFEKIKIPVLVVYGEKDDNLRPDMNIPPIEAALDKAGNKHYRIEILSNNDHYFLLHNGKLLEKHVPGEMEISGELMKLITDWIPKD